MNAKDYYLEPLSVGVSSYIDQDKDELIGYRAYYMFGRSEFYQSLSEIPMQLNGMKLVTLKQVGRRKPKKDDQA